MGPKNVAKNHLPHPERFFEKPLFDMLERRGYKFRDLNNIGELPDEEVRTRLHAIPGLGPWSSGMFLLFHLGRPDVFLAGDIGVRKAIAKLTKLFAMISTAPTNLR